MGSKEERFGASARTLRYGFIAHDRRDLIVEGKRYATMEASYRRDERGNLVAKDDVSGLVDASPHAKREVQLEDHPPLSDRAGARLGRVVVKVDGKEVGRIPLLAERGYEKPSRGPRLWYTVGGIFE
jgi:D-alanyl-D-alanine carboxypeptidase